MTHSLPFWPACLAALLLPLSVCVFSPLPVAFLVPLTALIGVAWYRGAEGAWPKFDWPLYGWIAAFAILGALSSLWSVTPDASLERAWKIGALLLASLPLLDLARLSPPETARRAQGIIPWLVLALGTLCLGEDVFGLPLHRLIGGGLPTDVTPGSLLNKNVAAFCLLLPLALLCAQKSRQYIVAGLLLIVAAGLFFVTESQAAQLALIVMPLAWFALFVLPDAGIPAAFIKVALLLVLMPWVAPILFDLMADRLAETAGIAARASASARLENWDFIARKIMTDPWRGFGMDATRAITDFQTEKLYFPSNRIMHPHNGALQIWIEFGLPGVVLTLGFLGFLLKRLLALPKPERRAPFVLFCGTLVFMLLSWSLWSAWLLALVIYICALKTLAAGTTAVPLPSSDLQ